MAFKPPRPPDAFLSYTRFDDEHDGGAISEFRTRLANAVRAVTGQPFEIFQDVDGIGLGEHWPNKLDRLLDKVRFFIPILTPSYFESKACRDELEKFLKAERLRGRNDLVLPIYYISCAAMEDASARSRNRLAGILHERQRWDWRELRFRPISDPDVRRSLEALALEIDQAWVRAKDQAEQEAPQRVAQEERRKIESQARRRRAEEQAAAKGQARQEARCRAAESAHRQKARPTITTPGAVFRDIDAPWCPELVVIPPGEFMMGSTKAERQWAVAQGISRECVEREKPQHRVHMAYPLAVGRFPVTFEEYDHFALGTRRAPPGDAGWGRDRQPVINVSWEDAKAYVEWLAAETRRPYRLLSEAEWEYACRAGTMTRYWWGDEITADKANYGSNLGQTNQVGNYPANPFGLCDTHGNVWEWVEDSWHNSYDGATNDGSAWTADNDSRRVLRGGSWSRKQAGVRSASRTAKRTDYRENKIGFRVARTLTGNESLTHSIQQVRERRAEQEAHDRAKPAKSKPAAESLPKPVIGFRDIDAPWCPELVVITPGEFMMGSTEPERRWAMGQGAQREWVDWEKPQHRVVISELFAVGKHPITRGQFATFVEATAHDMGGGCWVFTDDKWEHSLAADWCTPGFEQTDDHPVVGVSWHDATAYVEWLGRETGQPYRLLSEGEWEYACRATTTTRYSWGDDLPTPQQANFGMQVRATTVVGRYEPNSFGLYDMHGNVLEWCQDCWNEGYAGGPRDGSAWTTGTCGRRVLRGGSWYDMPALLRSANRSGFNSGTRNANVGFRVARTLPRSEGLMRALQLLGSGTEPG